MIRALQAAEKLNAASICAGFVSGHDFSRADKAHRMIRALQAAEKLTSTGLYQRFVSGHDFSRADKANKMRRALAPAKPPWPYYSKIRSFSAACFSPCKNTLAVL